MDPLPDPVLAAPGAGLPFPELLIARLLLKIACFTETRESATARFEMERQLIERLIAASSGEQRRCRVLISRPRGLEDSSRYWSVWMTLDHLRIVNDSIVKIIESLTSGRIPEGQASTATVKPNGEAGEEIWEAYKTSCYALLRCVGAATDLKTSQRFSHPWFGPMDAASWHILAGRHMGIHRVQIERILAGQKTA